MKKTYKRPVTTISLPFVITGCICESPIQEDFASTKQRGNDFDGFAEEMNSEKTWGNIW